MTQRVDMRHQNLGMRTAAALALAGWSLVIGTLLYAPEWIQPPKIGAPSLWLGALAVVARLLAFNIHRSSRIAIDSSFYIACVFITGGATATLLILIVLTVDASIRALRGEREGITLRSNVIYVLFKSGLPSFALMLLTMGFSEARLLEATDRELWLLLPTFSLTFLLVHYALVGSRQALESSDGREIRPIVSRAVVAELSLIPLSLAMVLAYRASGLGLMVLLGATGLLTSLLFRRSVLLSNALTRRVRDLMHLNESGKLLASCIDEERLWTNLPEALRQLSPVMVDSILEVGLLSDESPELVKVHRYLADGATSETEMVPVEASLANLILRESREAVEDGRRMEVYDTTDSESGERTIGLPLRAGEAWLGALWIRLPQGHQRLGPKFFPVFQIAVDQVAVALNNTKLYALATVDGLTGLFIRRYLDQRAVEEWERFRRYKTPFSVIMIDLDHFKKLNDRYGHQAGDLALKIAADAVGSNMRGFDVAARYGGEELACLLPRTNVTEAGVVAERIRADIEAAKIYYQGVNIAVSASIGVADSTQKTFDCWEMVRVHADEALLEAKASGRNRVHLAKNQAIPLRAEG